MGLKTSVRRSPSPRKPPSPSTHFILPIAALLGAGRSLLTRERRTRLTCANGSAQWSNAQPIVQHGRARTVALGHNGNLVNAGELREELAADGVRLGSSSDTELIAALIANDPAPLADAVANTMVADATIRNAKRKCVLMTFTH